MRFVPKYLQAVGATVLVIGVYDALRTFARRDPTRTPADSWLIFGGIGVHFLLFNLFVGCRLRRCAAYSALEGQ